ncbi:enoyl-CoA hydratase/isomerase family protein [Nocardioides sp.]|nr:enoyl-CoA hydratase/isomerase family protein [Nocardioides sp.]
MTSPCDTPITSDVECEVDGPVATIALNRPSVRNAQRPAMWAAMAQFLASLDDAVRIVVVRGNGGTFSAGLDLALLDPAQVDQEGSLVAIVQKSDQEIVDQIGDYQQAFALLADPKFISIAAVNGHAIGAGFQLALACDQRIATEDAQFCMKEPALGLVPDLGGTKPLVEAVGYGRALEICASARMVKAAEAHCIGLVQSVVPPHALDDAVTAAVRSLTAHGPSAVRAIKALLQQAPHRGSEEQRLGERMAQVDQLRELATRHR